MKSKVKFLKIIFSSSVTFIVFTIIVLIPILMIMDFFGANITNGYIENNSEYADMYKNVVSQNLKSGIGYVSLSRILYFYLEDSDLTFEQIYLDNIDNDLKQEKPISDVCEMPKYKNYSVCNDFEISESNQINEVQNKPFVSPIKISNLDVTSFFMEERIVYGKSDIHPAWDFSSQAQTPIYSVCDGEVIDISFNYSNNAIDTNGGYGNKITVLCFIDDITYNVIYAHLYPDSSSLQKGDSVKQGQEIASVGTTGYSTGNHLHFEVNKDGMTIDGMSLIDFSIDK